MGGMNIIVTVRNMRGKGMSWDRVTINGGGNVCDKYISDINNTGISGSNNDGVNG
jgi:hypothetical protein